MDTSLLQSHLPEGIYNQLSGILEPFDINGPLRLSHLLGQAQHECSNWTLFIENLNYSAQRLANTWPGRYAIDPHVTPKVPNDLAKSLEHRPEAIANNCYANRNGNGSEESGQGWLYRGRGCIQLTGKSNYQAFGEFLGIDLLTTPDLVATDYQLASAAFFFKENGLWTICDRGVIVETITAVTKRVNGPALLGLQERILHTQTIYNLLHD